MTEVTLDRKSLLGFIAGFGEVDDLRLSVAGTRVTGEVGFSTHYLRRTLVVDEGSIAKEGDIDIGDVSKLTIFCKRAKTTAITLKQTGSGKLLYINAGSMKLQLPTPDSIVSHAKTPLVRKIVSKSSESMWTTWMTGTSRETLLEVHGDIDTKELKAIGGMKGVIGAPVFRVLVNAEEGEFSVQAGKKHTPRLFLTTEMQNPQGPNATIGSSFGSWFMQCVNILDDGMATIHFGEGTVLIIEQGHDLLIIVDQKE
tara:strand:+ start:7081 stop:7845 length:765 start_codon:yes stop_codon:yes gene_type:complete